MQLGSSAPGMKNGCAVSLSVSWQVAVCLSHIEPRDGWTESGGKRQKGRGGSLRRLVLQGVHEEGLLRIPSDRATLEKSSYSFFSFACDDDRCATVREGSH
mmetsp:Transcript_44270/g.87366  ORF Transcript_44270/g.87366 Transcript_44270/m.87366 type:complete len:101 (-) Transcript_44270:325-627(-)